MTKGVNGKGKEVEKNMVEAYKKGRRKEEEKMIKRVVSIALTIVVFAALFGLIAPVQARCIPFTIYGQVFDTDGTTPVDGVNVTITNIETGSSEEPTITALGGYYADNLGHLKPNCLNREGDKIKIFADDGTGKTNTTVVSRAAISPQLVDPILNPAHPNITSFAPPSPVNDYEGVIRTFNITINQPVDVSWQINGTEVQTNASVTAASYTNMSAANGTWNVSAIVNNANGTDMQTWAWIVEPSPCFIATAAYGTALHEDIDVLRDFRDEYLMPNPVGRTFVKIYYTTSSPIAEVIRENEGLRTAVRDGLVKPLVHITEMVVG